MLNTLTTTPQLIGLAAAGAAALGLDLSEGLLQPLGKLSAIRTLPPRGTSTPTRAERRAANRAAHAALQAAAASASAPTPEQAAELARQLAEHGGTAAVAADPLSVRAPGYDPEFTPNPENFGQLG